MPTFPTDSSLILKEHIKQSERRMMKAYFDPAGVPTAGYGHIEGITADMARAQKVFTALTVDRWFEEDVDKAEAAVRKYVTRPLNQNQFDALVDFVFNLGSGAFASSTLLKKLNAGEFTAVPAQLMRWTKAKDPRTGKLVDRPGLVTRRKWEAALFVGGPNADLAKSGPAPYGRDVKEATVIPAKPDKPTLWGVILDLVTAIFKGIFRA